MFGPKRRHAEIERRLVWILGSPRSGSTWLLGMLRTLSPRVHAIDEPAIGAHLGLFSADVFNVPAERFEAGSRRVHEMRAGNPAYFFCEARADAWLPALRALLLERFGAETPRGAIAVIKEPNGSQGADLIARALPRSRLLFLLRDGRDIIDSQLDAREKGRWLADAAGASGLSRTDREEFIRERAWRWVMRTEIVQAAYDAHDPALRLKLTYEDLRADPASHLSAIASWMGLDDTGDAAAVADRLSFENVPADKKGEGQFVRAASPGLWREHFSDAEVAVIEEVAGPTLRAHGYTTR